MRTWPRSHALRNPGSGRTGQALERAFAPCCDYDSSVRGEIEDGAGVGREGAGGSFAGFGPSMPPVAARGGRVEVRSLPDGEEIVLRPTGLLRYLPAAFLAFWLCGWAVGEIVVLVLLLGPAAAPLLEAVRDTLPFGVGRIPLPSGSLPLPVLAFLGLWLTFWTWGGIGAAWELLRLLAGSDRYVLRPGSFTYRRCAGPFGRTREFRAASVEGIVDRRRKSQLVAMVAGKEVALSAGVPAEVGPWLAARLRAALGLVVSGKATATAETTDPSGPSAAVAPAVPSQWQATPRPEGGVVLAAPPARSRKAAGCALVVAVLVTMGAVALVAAAFAKRGHVDGIVGVATAAVVATILVDALCLWVAVARDRWVLSKGHIERSRSFGPWSRRRAVRNGTLVVRLSTDDDGDDWFELEARGDGGSLRLEKSMNAGPEVLAFARFAAWHSGFPLDVPREAREAAGEAAEG